MVNARLEVVVLFSCESGLGSCGRQTNDGSGGGEDVSQSGDEDGKCSAAKKEVRERERLERVTEAVNDPREGKERQDNNSKK